MEFVRNINKNNSMKYVWSKMKVLRNKKSVVNWNDWKNKDRSETVKKEIDKIGRPWMMEEEMKMEYDESVKFDKWEEELNREFKMSELNRALNKVRVKSAPEEVTGVLPAQNLLWKDQRLKGELDKLLRRLLIIQLGVNLLARRNNRNKLHKRTFRGRNPDRGDVRNAPNLDETLPKNQQRNPLK